MDRRVVITGIGMVTPLGAGKEAFARALWQGETGIREIAAFPTEGLASHLGAEVARVPAPRFHLGEEPAEDGPPFGHDDGLRPDGRGRRGAPDRFGQPGPDRHRHGDRLREHGAQGPDRPGPLHRGPRDGEPDPRSQHGHERPGRPRLDRNGVPRGEHDRQPSGRLRRNCHRLRRHGDPARRGGRDLRRGRAISCRLSFTRR